jgi:hypothetical protein
MLNVAEAMQAAQRIAARFEVMEGEVKLLRVEVGQLREQLADANAILVRVETWLKTAKAA